MKTAKMFLRCLGVLITVNAILFMVVHRFQHTDITNVRWFIDYYPIWVGNIISIILGRIVYLLGLD